MLIDPDRAVMKRLGHSFKALGANITSVEFLGRALDHVRVSPVDLLFCGPMNDGANAKQIVKLFRAADYLRPIVAIGWSKADLHEARQLEEAGVIASIEPGAEFDVLKVIGTSESKSEPGEQAA